MSVEYIFLRSSESDPKASVLIPFPGNGLVWPSEGELLVKPRRGTLMLSQQVSRSLPGSACPVRRVQ